MALVGLVHPAQLLAAPLDQTALQAFSGLNLLLVAAVAVRLALPLIQTLTAAQVEAVAAAAGKIPRFQAAEPHRQAVKVTTAE